MGEGAGMLVLETEAHAKAREICRDWPRSAERRAAVASRRSHSRRRRPRLPAASLRASPPRRRPPRRVAALTAALPRRRPPGARRAHPVRTRRLLSDVRRAPRRSLQPGGCRADGSIPCWVGATRTTSRRRTRRGPASPAASKRRSPTAASPSTRRDAAGMGQGCGRGLRRGCGRGCGRDAALACRVRRAG